MGRYIGPRCRLCRREGVKLFLKGNKCVAKCTLEKRASTPGQRGKKPKKMSDYGIHLREKQKAKRVYGMMEKQFKKYFHMARREDGVTGENLLRFLERRFDNVVFRLGFASSRSFARQLVRHGHVTVNNRKVDVPSYLVKVGDAVKIKEGSERLKKQIKESMESSKERGVPSWLELDETNLAGIIKALPSRGDVAIPINEQLIVEFYSK